jgi:hypothetical protein
LLSMALGHLYWASAAPVHRWNMRPCWGLWDEVLASSRSGVRTLLTARTKYRWLSRVCVHGGCGIECRRAWMGAGLASSRVVQLVWCVVVARVAASPTRLTADGDIFGISQAIGQAVRRTVWQDVEQ